MRKELLEKVALFLRQNANNEHKINLIAYLQEQICKYACNEKIPAEQVKGMNMLLRDIIDLDARLFGEDK